MTKEQYISAISKQRLIQSVLNNIYIWSRLAVLSLGEIEKHRDFLEKISSFSVPSKSPHKVVNRSTDNIIETLKKARTTEFYKAMVVYVVSIVEPVLLEIVRLTMQYDKRRIKTKPKGCDGKLEYDTIIDCDDYDDIMQVIIAKQIDVLSYSKPNDQLEYIEKLLSIEIDDVLWGKWIEIKASRDLIVHNKSIINKVYLDKVGKFARGTQGKEITVDEDYYKSLIVISKSLIGKIVSQITKKVKTDGN